MTFTLFNGPAPPPWHERLYVAACVGETDKVPPAGFTEVPFMAHETVFVQLHESTDDCGGTISVGLAEKVQLGAITVINTESEAPQASVAVSWYKPGWEYETDHESPAPIDHDGSVGPVEVHEKSPQPPEAVAVTMLPTGTVVAGVMEIEGGEGAFTVIGVAPDFVGS